MLDKLRYQEKDTTVQAEMPTLPITYGHQQRAAKALVQQRSCESPSHDIMQKASSWASSSPQMRPVGPYVMSCFGQKVSHLIVPHLRLLPNSSSYVPGYSTAHQGQGPLKFLRDTSLVLAESCHICAGGQNP